MTTIAPSSHTELRSTITEAVAMGISLAGAGLKSCGSALRSLSNSALSLLSTNSAASKSPVNLMRSESTGHLEFQEAKIDQTHGIANRLATKESISEALTQIRNELTHVAKMHALGGRGESGGNISRDRSLAGVAVNSFGTTHILSPIQPTTWTGQEAMEVRLEIASGVAHDFVYRGDDQRDENLLDPDAMSRPALGMDDYYEMFANATKSAN